VSGELNVAAPESVQAPVTVFALADATGTTIMATSASGASAKSFLLINNSSSSVAAGSGTPPKVEDSTEKLVPHVTMPLPNIRPEQRVEAKGRRRRMALPARGPQPWTG
jgi:hypothetical protein